MRFFKRLIFGVCGLITLATTNSASATELYAATASGHVTGELYIIDSSTGAVVQDIGPLNDANSLNYAMTGLAFDPVSGVLYGSSASGSTDAAARNKLVTINPATGLVNVVGSYGLGGAATGASMADLAFDPTTDVLYGIATVGGAHLYSINTTTGAATLVGNSGFTITSGGGVAVSPAGAVFGSPTLNNFGTYNKTTGAYANIANPAKPAGGGYGALAFNGSVLYGLNLGLPPHLVTIDTSTGVVTDVAPTLTSLDAIAFRPATTVLAGDYNNNGTVDAADYPLWRKNNGTSNSLGPNDPLGVPITLAQYTQWRGNFGKPPGSGVSVSSVPEPSGAALILVSLLAVLPYRRWTAGYGRG